MEYFSKNQLTKSYHDGKLYVGGYSLDLDEPNIQTYKNDTDDIMDILNLGLSVPLIYYSKSNNNNEKSNIKNTYDNSVVNESLHNKLLGILNKSTKTKKNKKYNKKTRKHHHHY
tara:strand:- start:716 stop:1057 length:342 start_codon:yes stop_codon:yes gene_type:complete